MSHTPTPWNEKYGDTIIASTGAPVATTDHPYDAAFIVKAVNAHDDLVAALKDALARSELRTDTKLNAETLLRNLGAL